MTWPDEVGESFEEKCSRLEDQNESLTTQIHQMRQALERISANDTTVHITDLWMVQEAIKALAHSLPGGEIKNSCEIDQKDSVTTVGHNDQFPYMMLPIQIREAEKAVLESAKLDLIDEDSCLETHKLCEHMPRTREALATLSKLQGESK